MEYRYVPAAALALGLLMSFAPSTPAHAQVAPPPPTPAPNATPMPYPAYGTPAPGVAQTRAQTGVPQQITLAQAIAIAAAKSPVLASARAAFQSTKANYDLAKTGYQPNISGNAAYARNNSGSVGGLGVNATPSPGATNAPGVGNGVIPASSLTSKNVNVTLHQLIFDGGRVVSEIHSARANEVAGGQTYERQLETLAFNVGQAYYAALQARAATQLAAQVVHQNEVQEDLIRAQIRAGTAARVDLATAEVPTAQARVALVRAQGQEISAFSAFANTLGLDADIAVAPIDDTTTIGENALILPPLTYDQSVSRALALRPDYLAAQATVQSAQYNVRAARLGNFPSINGSANYGSASVDTTGSVFRGNSSIGATLTIPLYDQGITRAQTEAAQAQLDNATAQLENTRINVELNVRQTLANLVSSQAALAQTDVELSTAQQVLSATQAQYKAGVTTLPLLLNAQVGLTQAQTDRLNAIYTLRQAQQQYFFALGQNDLTVPAPSP